MKENLLGEEKTESHPKKKIFTGRMSREDVSGERDQVG